MRRLKRWVGGWVAGTGAMLAPSEGSAQRLAVEDPVLRGIWTEAMERSQVERLSQALLDSIGPRLTAHTHRDTFDKVVFDDLRNNAVLTASLAYLAAQSPERVSRGRRDVMTDFQVRPVSWPECQPAVRRTQDSPRMQ